MDNAQKKYSTDRLNFFRTAQELDTSEEKAITNIETVGCHIISVRPDDTGQGWAYSLGIYDTCGKPEIIVIGLHEDLASSAINEAHRRLLDGVDLSKGRHQDFLLDVDCEFRPVAGKWIRRPMGWAYWYNCGDDFPVLQLVYPDKQNRFPEDSDFDTNFACPLLQPNAPETHDNKNFWARNDPDSVLSNWKFPDGPHVKVFLSQAVHEKSEQVTYVSHESEDGAWQFLGDSMSGDQPPVISCFHHPVDNDPSLQELADLPLGWWAERATPNDPWVRYQHEPEEESM